MSSCEFPVDTRRQAGEKRLPVKLLFLGDVFGKPGRQAVQRLVPRLVARHGIDLVVANAENAARLADGGKSGSTDCHNNLPEFFQTQLFTELLCHRTIRYVITGYRTVPKQYGPRALRRC